MQVCWWSMAKFETGEGARYGMYTPGRRRQSLEALPMCAPAATYVEIACFACDQLQAKTTYIVNF